MKIYRISRTSKSHMDSYTEAIVAAKSKKEARNMHPDGTLLNPEEACRRLYSGSWWMQTWDKPKKVNVEYLGEAKKSIKKKCVLCASFYGV